MKVTPEQIEQAQAFTGRSRTHVWTDAERTEYDALRARGRSLYDALRTLHGTTHAEAFEAARATHGIKEA